MEILGQTFSQTKGVQQGSVFGTLFFIYYINQINKEIKDLNMEINKSKIFGPKFK